MRDVPALWSCARHFFLGSVFDCTDYSHEVHHGPRIQLPHGIATMHLNGDFAHPELGGDLLVHLTRDDQGHDIMLAHGQGVESRAQVGRSRSRLRDVHGRV